MLVLAEPRKLAAETLAGRIKVLSLSLSSGRMGGAGVDRSSVGIRRCGGGSDEQGLGSFWHVQQRLANRHFLKGLKDITLKCNYG